MKSFYALIAAVDQASGAERQTMEAVVWKTFGTTCAVLALDMANFSLLVRRDGILAYLCLIQQMQRVTGPIVVQHGGEVVKYEADNLIAVFPSCSAAVRAALAVHRAFADDQQRGGRTVQVSIGIDWGQFLLVRGGDCFGDPVNRAHKLGEDLARAGETLVSPEVHDQIGEAADLRWHAQQVSVFGSQLSVWRVESG